MDESDSERDDRGDRVDRGEPEASEGKSVQDAAVERQHERTERVEDALARVREDLGNHKYPVSSEELSARYADQPIDLPNETESLGSVFRRLDESFEDEQTAYQAVVSEISAGERFDDRADVEGAEPATWSEERAETQHEFEDVHDSPVDEEDYESSVVRSRDRAREAQAESDGDRTSEDEERTTDR